MRAWYRAASLSGVPAWSSISRYSIAPAKGLCEPAARAVDVAEHHGHVRDVLNRPRQHGFADELAVAVDGEVRGRRAPTR